MPSYHLIQSLFGLVLCVTYLNGLPATAADPAADDVPAVSSHSHPGPLRVMTLNIRYDNPDDGPNAWPHRRDHVAELIRDHRVDLVGLQEVLHRQLVDLQQRLTGYRHYGVGREDGETKGEYAPIFYLEKRLEMLDKSVFWLSEQPDQPGSKGWDAALPRIVTWARFRDRATGQVLLFFNTHFDHRGRTARQESARLLSAKVFEIAGPLPIVVTGDLNTLPTSAAYRNMLLPATVGDGRAGRRLHDARAVCLAEPRGPDSTWNGFRAIAPGRRIDYVFVSDAQTAANKATETTPRRQNGTDKRVPPHGVKVLSHRTLDNHYEGRFPSDHLPVLADLELSLGQATDPVEQVR